MKSLRLIPILILSIVYASCERDDLIPEHKGNPTIYINGSVDGTDLILSAGVNGYKANTPRFDFYPYRFWGSQIISDSSTKNSITISIGNYKYPYSDSLEDLTKSIIKGKYNYVSGPDLQPSQVIINLIYNEDSYETSIIQQPSSSFFEISHVKDTLYNGKLYKISELEFDCLGISRMSSEVVNLKAVARLVYSNN